MALTAPEIKETKYELIPADSYHAICISVIDLGTHDTEYKGKPKERHMIMLTWELPDHRIKSEDDNNDRPYVVSRKYTFSMHEKATLRKEMQKWRGKKFTTLEAQDFDFEKLLGVNGIIQIVHNTVDDNVYANMDGIQKLMKGMDKRESENKHLFWTFRDGIEFPDNMPEWIKEIIMDSKEVEMILDAQKDTKITTEGTVPGEPGWDGDTKDMPF